MKNNKLDLVSIKQQRHSASVTVLPDDLYLLALTLCIIIMHFVKLRPIIVVAITMNH